MQPGGGRLRSALTWLDMPPVWLAAFAALARVQVEVWPFGPGAFPAAQLLGGLLLGGGVVLALRFFLDNYPEEQAWPS